MLFFFPGVSAGLLSMACLNTSRSYLSYAGIFSTSINIFLTYFSEGQLIVASICDRKVFGCVKVSGQADYVAPLMLVGGVNVGKVEYHYLLPGRQLLERLLVL